MVDEWDMSTEHWWNALSITSYHKTNLQEQEWEDELEMFCNFYRNMEATDQGSGHMMSGKHKFCTQHWLSLYAWLS